MTKQYSIAEAQDHLNELIPEIEEGATVELTRDGEPVAVVMSVEAYQRLCPKPALEAKSGDLWAAIERFRASVTLEELEEVWADGDPFADVRDSSPGREFSW